MASRLRRLLGEARKRTNLTPKEQAAFDDLRNKKLNYLDFRTFELKDLPLAALKTLQQKGLIYVQVRVRLTPKGVDW
jgi:hypothetical protein